MLMFSLIIFTWYYHDSNQRSYQRSALLNIGVVTLAIVAIPYYLIRTRERGQKSKAILHLAGFFVLIILSSVVGAIIGSLIS